MWEKREGVGRGVGLVLDARVEATPTHHLTPPPTHTHTLQARVKCVSAKSTKAPRKGFNVSAGYWRVLAVRVRLSAW